MGLTTNAINTEVARAIQAVSEPMLKLEKTMTRGEKAQVRAYIEGMNGWKTHMYATLFLEKKIKKIINSRQPDFILPVEEDLTYISDFAI